MKLDVAFSNLENQTRVVAPIFSAQMTADWTGLVFEAGTNFSVTNDLNRPLPPDECVLVPSLRKLISLEDERAFILVEPGKIFCFGSSTRGNTTYVIDHEAVLVQDIERNLRIATSITSAHVQITGPDSFNLSFQKGTPLNGEIRDGIADKAKELLQSMVFLLKREQAIYNPSTPPTNNGGTLEL